MQETRTIYAADGTLLSQETVEVPDLPAGIDLVALADQLAAVSEAVDYLILDSLGAF